jgi:hypothetical protein
VNAWGPVAPGLSPLALLTPALLTPALLTPALLTLALLVSGCDGAGGAASCEDISADLESAVAAVQTCSADADCGLAIEGTSCQPECDLAARLDADTTAVDALIDDAFAQQCELPWEARCDCPTPVGAVCTDAGTCEWDWGE